MTFWTSGVGEGGILLRFGTGIKPETSSTLLSFLSLLENSSTKPQGIIQILPSYASLLIQFDPLVVSRSTIEQWCQEVEITSQQQQQQQQKQTIEKKVVEIPVKYGGEGGPDLEKVAEMCGISKEEVIKLHSDPEYRVYFLGFVGGFPYLGGLSPSLSHVPRLSTPRPRLPPGTVGIAAGQTGIYPISSPGGWHCLGRTSRTLFSPHSSPPSLLSPGDHVKFVEETTEPNEQPSQDINDNNNNDIEFPSWIEIISPGPLTSVQDLGRPKYGRFGVSKSGICDPLALKMANSLLGNEENAAVLEVVMGGLEFVCVCEWCSIALTGADFGATLRAAGRESEIPLRLNEVIVLQQGDRVKLNFPQVGEAGMRGVVGVGGGGVGVKEILNSKSTDLKGGFGGFFGRKLKEGDKVGRVGEEERGEGEERKGRGRGMDVRRLFSQFDPLREGEGEGKGEVWEVRVMRGPGDPGRREGKGEEEEEGDFESLLSFDFEVMNKSDRMAVCLLPSSPSPSSSSSSCEPKKIKGGQQLSEALVSGTIQVPPDGKPIILLAEHQTTGGYKIPAVVIAADMWKVGQMKPSDTIRLKETSEKEAVEALKELQKRATATVPFSLKNEQKGEVGVKRKEGEELGRIDLNADAGEGFDDEGLLKYVTSVNIACGGHVGSPDSIARTVFLATRAGASIGAHPSFEDKEGFGRRKIEGISKAEVRDQVLWQVSGLMNICKAYGTTCNYIKPHGALYHEVVKGTEVGEAVVEVAHLLSLPLLLMPACPYGTFGEGFAERAYDGDHLRPRSLPGAVIHDQKEAAAQGVNLAKRENIHSICIHGDSPGAVEMAKCVREGLVNAGFKVTSFMKAPEMRPLPLSLTPPPPLPTTTPENILNRFFSPSHKFAKYKTKTITTTTNNNNNNDMIKTIEHILHHQVSPIITNGYRPHQGVTPSLYPPPSLLSPPPPSSSSSSLPFPSSVPSLLSLLSSLSPQETSFSKFSRGEILYEEYIQNLKQQLDNQGGGWVTVAPRDTCQQGNDSESFGIQMISRLNAEIFAIQAGCVGYEIGGAQYQVSAMRGFDPALVVGLGLPYNMPGHSLMRSQYVNGLSELSEEVRKELFQTTGELVLGWYDRMRKEKEKEQGQHPLQNQIPWFPYNFHAGNYFNENTDYSPQDMTNGELLEAGCTPMPCWVFSMKFPRNAFEKWVHRQIALFEKYNRNLCCLRIKNPGQGPDWTAKNVWSLVETIVTIFDEKKKERPIIYIHNHDFNGMGAHVGAKLFKKAQNFGYRYLVIDGAYRKNGTHNDNTALLSSLNLSPEQKIALSHWNHNQQLIEKILCRFDSRASQMTPWDSEWAGGTEGSDIRISKEFHLDVRKINLAKELASNVFPLERAVTPFSEYKLRLGIAIMIEDEINPKTEEEVEKFLKKGGKLRVGGAVLVGLDRWETLVERGEMVNKLLENMRDELEEGKKGGKTKEIQPKDLESHFSVNQKFSLLGFQKRGEDFITGLTPDLSSLLPSPHILHCPPKSLEKGVEVKLLLGGSCGGSLESSYKEEKGKEVREGEGIEGIEIVSLQFGGFEVEKSGEISLQFEFGEVTFVVIMEEENNDNNNNNANANQKASLPTHLPSHIPGELVKYEVKEGEELKEGGRIGIVESMKMEVVVGVPGGFVGKKVKKLALKERTREERGSMIAPGDVLLVVE